MNEIVEIPKALLFSESYIALSADQKNNLAKRLNYILELVNNTIIATNTSSVNIRSLIEDIELDTTAISCSYSDATSGLSVYAINTILTADCDVHVLHGQLDGSIKSTIEDVGRIPYVTTAELSGWLNQWAVSLGREITAFSISDSYDKALSHLLVINALVGLVTCATALARLNTTINS